MKKSLYLGASMLAVAAAAIVPASAADMYRAEPVGYKDAPIYVPAATWTGFYAGINGGYGWRTHDDQFAFVNDTRRLGGTLFVFNGLGADGGFGGGQIGYNWQVPGSRLVLGVEADIQGSGISASGFDGVETFKSSLDWFGTVRGRIGYAFDTSLIYFTGGFAYGGVDNRDDGKFSPFHFKTDGVATGYVLGGGYEYKLSPAWSLKAEYQYISLGKNDPVDTSEFKGQKLSSADIKINEDAFHTVRVGLNYHIGRGYEPLK